MGVAQMPATIFVTAFSEHAVKAFEVQALDYLTKPVQPERLQAALTRVRQQLTQKLSSEQFLAALAGLQAAGQKENAYPKRMLVRNGTKDSFVSVSDIVWIEAADYYACLHAAGRKHMLRESIRQLEETLDAAKFVRIHRSAIVNIDHVREIERDGRSEGWVVLDSGQRLRMSKAGWQKLLAASQR
jgi:two-component system LytT family response regulator